MPKLEQMVPQGSMPAQRLAMGVLSVNTDWSWKPDRRTKQAINRGNKKFVRKKPKKDGESK
jgi:hypothetical protein